MRVNLGRGDMAMAKELLDRADIVALFKKLRRETVSQRVGGSMLRDLRPLNCFLYGLLELPTRRRGVAASRPRSGQNTCCRPGTRIAIPTANPRWDTCGRWHPAVSCDRRPRASPFREYASCSSSARSDPALRMRATSSPCPSRPCLGEPVFPFARNPDLSPAESNTPAIEDLTHTPGGRPAGGRLPFASKPIGPRL